jgi:hypothetical protein
MRSLIWRVMAGLLLPTAALAGLMIHGSRYYSSSGGESPSDWADVFVAADDMGAELATNSRIVGIDGANISAFGANVTESTGCSVTYEAGGAYDGENSVLLVPPSSGGGNSYCAVITSNVTDSGANDIAQINIRWVAVLGPRYIDLAASAKWLCVGVSSTAGGTRLNRACTFDVYDSGSALGRTYSVTSDEVQSWHEPEIAECWSWDCGTASQKGFIVRSTADHSGSPAVAGPNEPIYFELELDVRQDRGNANGRNRLYIKTRDGLIDRTIDIPLTWDGSWPFTLDQIIEIEGLGWYFNTVGTAHADSWIRYSHIAISANRAVDDPIGPPPGFDQ